MTEKPPEEEPKLIIDEDWKTQVQREKEQLKQEKEGEASEESSEEDATATEAPAPDAEQDVAETSGNEAGTPPPPPPATMTFLITSLATQAMAALGQFPGDDGQPLPVNKDYARHFIDLLSVLEEKTKGNLDAQEEKFLTETLHQMRMLFVSQG